MKLSLTIFFILTLVGCQSTTLRQHDPGGKAVIYNKPFGELPQKVRPNDATISIYQARYGALIQRRESQNRLYIIEPKGNAVDFKYEPNEKSSILEKELSEGYILSYLFYDNGVIKYNGKAKDVTKYLNIEHFQIKLIKEYPMIKCNINNDRKLYHLPFDPAYDSIIIGNVNGECYANTIKEAQNLGFKRVNS